MDVHLRDLRYFAAVAEELNFTRAAERLYVSQPALSKQIRQLERAMRAPLLRREARGVTLTAAGALLLSNVRGLLETWDRTAAAVLAAGARDRRALRLGMHTSVGRNLYPAVVHRFNQSNPTWSVTLRLYEWTDPSAGLLDESSDAAFLWLPVPAGLEHRVLLSEPRWVAMPVGHRLANRVEIAIDDLLDEPFIALPTQSGPMRDYWLAVDERRGRPVQVALEANNADETFEAVASGQGIHLLAAGNAVIYARPGIVCRPVRDLSPCHLAVAWRQGDTRPQITTFASACEQAGQPVAAAGSA